MPSDDPAREIASSPLGVLALLLKLISLLRFVPHFFGIMFALYPLIISLDLIFIGVGFVLYGLLGLGQIILGANDFLLGVFPQFSTEARIAVYLGLIVVGPPIFLAGKKIYQPGKDIAAELLSQLRDSLENTALMDLLGSSQK